DAMGGHIGIDTQQSRFWISLPACQPVQTTAAAVARGRADKLSADSGSAVSRKRHVLYVEDQTSHRALMETILARHRHLKLHLAGNLQESMQWLADMQPDLLLIDLNLPDGAGESLIHYVRSQPHLRHIPRIVLIADALPATIAHLETLQVSHYFTKPVNVAAFNRQIMQLLPEPAL
ncbi:MAG TPA: response regulator, partial [Methylophilus sp.]